MSIKVDPASTMSVRKVMRRDSFLGSETTEIIKYLWPITGHGACEVGFGVCLNTGLVLQTTAVTPTQMLEYYAHTATYLNPNHNGQPMPAKANDVARLLQTLKFTINRMPLTVLQVGSSDGYTLSCFKQAGAQRVLGVEPGEQARSYALLQHGIESVQGTAENFDSKEEFELIVLTHVLEHLYDPSFALSRLQKNLSYDGYVLIEVPLWERLEQQPVGVLTFEHLNYFTELTLNLLLDKAGLVPVYSAKAFNTTQYPVITVIAQKANEQSFIKQKCEDGKQLLDTYIQKEADFWLGIKKHVLQSLDASYEVYIYGAGIHTSQLLHHVFVPENIDVDGYIDSSPTKQGKVLMGCTIKSPEYLKTISPASNVIVSSAASESYIVEAINSIRTDLNLITLYTGTSEKRAQ